MLRHLRCTAIIGACLFLPLGDLTVSGKEKGGKAPIDAQKERLHAALSLAGKSGFVVKGSVRTSDGRSGAGMGGTVIIAGAGVGAKPYQGPFQAWVDEEETLVAVSGKTLPGFEIYRSDGETLNRLTYEESPPGVEDLANDLTALLDMRRLRKWLGKTDLRVKVDEETGVTVFSGPAPRRLVPSGSGGPMAMMRAKVLRIEVEIEVGAGGKLLTAEFRVVRSDPTAALMRGGGGFGLPGRGEDDGEDKEGVTSVYRFDWTAARPSARLTGFKRTAEELIEDEE